MFTANRLPSPVPGIFSYQIAASGVNCVKHQILRIQLQEEVERSLTMLTISTLGAILPPGGSTGYPSTAAIWASWHRARKPARIRREMNSILLVVT